MSEEEKKAIELLKKLQKKTPYIIWEDGTPYNKSNQIQTILNLIDKQQKEIEDLKTITQNYNAIGGETFGDDRIIVCSMKYFDDGFFKRNYIFKNVLRELIENNEQDIDYSVHDLIEDLKRILEED